MPKFNGSQAYRTNDKPILAIIYICTNDKLILAIIYSYV